MDIQQLSTHGLLMLYQAVKLALDEDDGNPDDRPFQVRENSDWRRWSDEIASELDQRGTNYHADRLVVRQAHVGRLLSSGRSPAAAFVRPASPEGR